MLSGQSFLSTALVKVTIPSSITAIGNIGYRVFITTYIYKRLKGSEVFKKCSSLSMVTLSDGLIVLGAKMFANTALTVITVSSKIVSLGENK